MKENVYKLLKLLRQQLLNHSLLMWTSVAVEFREGNFQKHSTPLNGYRNVK